MWRIPQRAFDHDNPDCLTSLIIYATAMEVGEPQFRWTSYLHGPRFLVDCTIGSDSDKPPRGPCPIDVEDTQVISTNTP